MKCDIVLAGVGGQGILSIAAVLGMAAVENNLYLKQAETHGMSQRGGAVQSYLRLSDNPIYSDLIPAGEADIILSVEPMESLRYLPFLSKKGYVVTNTTPFVNIPDYPELDKVLGEVKKQRHHIAIDADKVAKEVGNSRASNMVMLGAASPFIDIPIELIEEGIRKIFTRKGEDIVNLNLEALRSGRKFAKENR
ncbi:indolepyruvate oxidoreductase subunit beta [Prolixibacter sp. SD074]|jgi:indolepyruvate ferredoxin oxidoreductase beta subunit|uniref:indolepyruvate oxidoreductase subunit beta n=1 Tax=Prolixibacter sp. SD074 TaxID=2652391 RepID=UPI0012803991|nr:indolepyruvate oxidoreductase subunit beta [Prolixibacter sp. SD074]GET29534.1 indolepyruvate oxidoreductase [Prolixibacter sp. SD074]